MIRTYNIPEIKIDERDFLSLSHSLGLVPLSRYVGKIVWIRGEKIDAVSILQFNHTTQQYFVEVKTTNPYSHTIIRFRADEVEIDALNPAFIQLKLK